MILELLRAYRYRLGIINSAIVYRLQTCNSQLLPEPCPNPRSAFGKSVTRSVLITGVCDHVCNLAVFGVAEQTLILWDLIMVTDADTDTDFNVLS